MKGKVGRGGGFRGVIEYALQESKGASIVGGTMTSTTPRALAAEFAISRQQRSEVERPVWHCSLSLPESDQLDDQGWHEVATDFVAEMGMSDHQYIVIRHADTEHDHIHIIASRIGLDASVWYGRWEARQVIEATQRLEIRHGLTTTPGLDATRERKVPTKNEVEQADRTEELPVRQRLQRLVDSAISEGTSVTAFCELLEFEGVEVRPNIASTGRLNGLSFSLDGIAFKGSQLGKGYTWSQLQKKGVTYEPDTEYGALSGRANSASRPADQEYGGESAGSDPANRGSDQPVVGGDPESRGVHRSGERVADRADEISPAGSDESRGPDRGIEGGGDLLPDHGDGLGSTPSEAHRSGGEAYSNPENNSPRVGDGDPEGALPIGENSESDPMDGGRVDALDRRSVWRRVADAVSDLAAGGGGGDLSPVAGSMTTSAQKAKVDAWRQQSQALGAPAYRITFTPRRDGLKPFNQGKGRAPGGGELTYTADEVEDLIPYMSRQNLRGYDVYVTPIDPDYHYLVVDDMTLEGHARLTEGGYAPAVVIESSKDNRQAVLKAPREAGQDEQSAANRVVQMLNKQIGDPEFSGVIHPFRVAGFSNKKPDRGNVFVKLIEVAGGICQKAADRLSRSRESLRDQKMQRERENRRAAADAMPEPNKNTIHQRSRDPVAEYRWRAKNQPADADWSRVDYGIAIGMLKDGWRREAVEGAIIEASPGVVDRHHNPQDYAQRTVANANESRQARQPSSSPKDEFGL